MEAEARDRREREERQRSERQLRFDSLQQAYAAAVDRLKTELAAAEQEHAGSVSALASLRQGLERADAGRADAARC